jgi:hypothetical protein
MIRLWSSSLRTSASLRPLRFSGDRGLRLARAPNFDIYLSRWLARWNKELFGTLFVLGVAYTWIRWRGR